MGALRREAARDRHAHPLRDAGWRPARQEPAESTSLVRRPWRAWLVSDGPTRSNTLLRLGVERLTDGRRLFWDVSYRETGVVSTTDAPSKPLQAAGEPQGFAPVGQSANPRSALIRTGVRACSTSHVRVFLDILVGHDLHLSSSLFRFTQKAIPATWCLTCSTALRLSARRPSRSLQLLTAGWPCSPGPPDHREGKAEAVACPPLLLDGATTV